MSSTFLPLFLVAIGTIIMAGNLILFISLAKEMRGIQTSSPRKLKLILCTYGVLISIFLLGYTVIGISFCVPFLKISYTLVGLIFFLGSIFVTIVTIMQLSLSRSVKKTTLDITRALICVVEARDPNLNGHSLHVARLTMLLYRYLPKAIQQSISKVSLEYAALLHDIGKLGIPESILNKKTRLSDEDWAEIRRHPLIGNQIVSNLPYSPEISDWILYHHERNDGKGYLGIPGSEIPMASRIIAVADTYSAITMPRSYHPARGRQEAVQIIRDCSGTQFDPDIAACFIQIPESEIVACFPDETVLFQLESQERAPVFGRPSSQAKSPSYSHSGKN